MEDKTLLNTREISQFLNINEKMVYSLISEKGLPATKVTGKWLFPKYLVEKWIENQTINYPKNSKSVSPCHDLLIITGSNDILLEKIISLFNRLCPEYVAVFGNIGSLGGIRTLNRSLCHIASSHLLQDDEKEYNFDFALHELGAASHVLVNFCRREQGLIIAKKNPKNISGIHDLNMPDIKIINRPEGTGTRLLFDRELKNAGLRKEQINGYNNEVRSHFDVALEIFNGKADAGLGIKPVASLLGLDFIPLRWERYDLLILKEHFFEQKVQLFLGLFHEPEFKKIAGTLEGYSLDLCGKIVFPQQIDEENKNSSSKNRGLI